MFATKVTMFGGCFDISHNNGPIKWSEVPDSYRLVFIKATQGTKFVDQRYEANVEGAEDTGRSIIPYHFISAEPAEVQCAHFLQTAHLGRGSLVMLDWEDPYGTDNLPPERVVEEMIRNLETTTGRQPIMYHGIYTLQNTFINKRPWMVPKYGLAPLVRGMRWAFWQNTPRGVVPGIHGPVDHDWFNGTYDELELFLKSGKLPANLVADPPQEV